MLNLKIFLALLSIASFAESEFRIEVCPRNWWFKNIQLSPGETVGLVPPNKTAFLCGFLIKPAAGEAVTLDCSVVNLLDSSKLFAKYSGGVKKIIPSPHTETYPVDKISKLAIMDWSSPNIGGTFGCTVSSGPGVAIPVLPTPSSEIGCTCGVINENRIVHGSTAEEGAWPWIAGIGTQEDKFRCAGSLVSSTKVVTSAHCLVNSDFKVYLGQHNLTESSADTIEREILHAVIHPSFNRHILDYNVAVLTIERVNLTKRISPICLPSGTGDLTGETVTVAGWGRTSTFGDFATVLQQTEMTVMSNSDCANIYHSYFIRDGMFCAGSSSGDSCFGDSGGPVMHKHSSDNAYDLVGMPNWGKGCGSDTYPGVNSRISEMKDWILEQIGGEDQLCPRPPTGSSEEN